MNCKSLTSIISEIEKPFRIENSVFAYTNPQLIVPNGTKTEYQVTEGWKRFANIVESSGIEGDVNCDNEVNELDVNDTVCYILGISPIVFNRSAADINKYNLVNATDIVLINNIINK